MTSPLDDTHDPALTSWVDAANDPRIEQFVEAFQEGSQAREQGASCDGALGEPIDV